MAAVIVFGRVAVDALNGNYDNVRLKLATVQGINDVHLAYDDEGFGYLEAALLSLRVAGKPKSLIEIWTPKVELFDDASHIALGRIGDIVTSVSYYDSNNKSERGGCVDIGRESDLKSILPFTPRNLGELVLRYDELEAYFKEWPAYPDFGTLRIESGQTIQYYRSTPIDRRPTPR